MQNEAITISYTYQNVYQSDIQTKRQMYHMIIIYLYVEHFTLKSDDFL